MNHIFCDSATANALDFGPQKATKARSFTKTRRKNKEKGFPPSFSSCLRGKRWWRDLGSYVIRQNERPAKTIVNQDAGFLARISRGLSGPGRWFWGIVGSDGLILHQGGVPSCVQSSRNELSEKSLLLHKGITGKGWQNSSLF